MTNTRPITLLNLAHLLKLHLDALLLNRVWFLEGLELEPMIIEPAADVSALPLLPLVSQRLLNYKRKGQNELVLRPLPSPARLSFVARTRGSTPIRARPWTPARRVDSCHRDLLANKRILLKTPWRFFVWWKWTAKTSGLYSDSHFRALPWLLWLNRTEW